MKQIPVSELEGPLLAEFVARAQEFEIFEEGEGGPIYYDKEDSFVEYVDDYRPDINGAQAMELAQRFTLVVNFETGLVYNPNNPIEYYDMVNIRNAICRVVVASEFGEYVEVSDDQ